MKVMLNTDRHIDGGEALAMRVQRDVEVALERYADRISRVEVHVSDENGTKHGEEDKRCMMEARLEGRPPMAVTSHSSTVDLAVHGAAAKLTRLIEHTLGSEAGHRNP
jgi:ribosome-associated translation inhibitor RaiA